MSALTQRVITAALLLPLVLWGIMALPTAYFALLFAAVCVLGAWEWAALAGSGSIHQRTLYTLLFVFGLAGAEYVTRSRLGLHAILAVAVLWWLTALALVWRYQSGRSLGTLSPGWRRAAGWLILIPSWVALVFLHGQPQWGVHLVIFLLALVWIADVAAFFVGRRWGKRRLASRVSPGKSWEGVAGALVAVAVVAAVTGWVLELRPLQTALLIALALVTVSASVLGDLTESLFKRLAGLKDSGRLLPGHGGVLDRIDSLTAAAPAFALGVPWLVEWL